MPPAMFGLLLLIAASATSPDRPNLPAGEAAASFEPTSRVTARATARLRIVSGASFGPGFSGGTDGGERRKTVLDDAAGTTQKAELLEFQ